jgi:SnoaL-like polyketide cyclase
MKPPPTGARERTATAPAPGAEALHRRKRGDHRARQAQQILAGDRVVSHLHYFTGHFTGMFKGAHGTGQPIDFITTDVLAVRAGKIADNWHLEDNLTFLQQIELVPR